MTLGDQLGDITEMSNVEAYEAYLKRKILKAKPAGFEPVNSIHPLLFDWQRVTVAHALRMGRYALFEERGLGKTLQQVEWARHIHGYTRQPILIVCPLAVARQTIREGQKIDVEIEYVRSMDDVKMADSPIMIINYDMLKHLEPDRFGGIVLDESSILKAYQGKTKQFIIEQFVPSINYRLFCSATPAPNDHLELGNHSEGLGVMNSNEMIARWFINSANDPGEMMMAGKYKILEHGKEDFWRWLASWAACISRPSDIGFSDEGYIRPPLNIQYHTIKVNHKRAWQKPDKKGQLPLFLNGALSSTDMWADKKETYQDRCRKAKELDEELEMKNEYHVIWCDMDIESKMLAKMMPDAVEVKGSDSSANKEAKLDDFSRGNVRAIVTKSKIAGMGLNWQHCAYQSFASVNYKWEEWYQAVGRTDRFGNPRQTTVNMIVSETEQKILQAHKRKGKAHADMQKEVNEVFAKYGAFSIGRKELELNLGNERMELPQWLKL
jgi:hypothetical protein